EILAGVDRLEHGRDLPHLGRGHMDEDIAVPVHNTSLPGGVRKDLGGALGKPQAGIRDDQADTGKASFFEMLEEVAPARLIFLGALADAENVPITAAIDADRNQERDIADLAGPAALEHNPIEIDVRV